jgi:hypothetical protein
MITLVDIKHSYMVKYNMNEQVVEFFAATAWTFNFKEQAVPVTKSDRELVQWLVHKSGWPYLPLELPGAPYADMLAEALSLEDLFIAHRSYGSPGWRSICLHGEAWNKTDYFTAYPENAGRTANDIVYKWTEIAERCPVTTQYFRDEFPNHNYQRLRYMWLDPQGYIEPHQDRTEHFLSPINVALNNPDGCVFRMKEQGDVPFKNSGNACLVDIGNIHSVWNNSTEPRIHMISHGTPSATFDKIVADSLRAVLK